MLSAIASLLMFASAAPDESETLVFNEIPFGKREIIAGTWFTNFESNRFLRCSGVACDLLPLSAWDSIECMPDVCAELVVAARRAANQWNVQQAPNGHFNVRFEGRVGLQRYPSRYLGDGQGRVLVERVLEVKTQEKSSSR